MGEGTTIDTQDGYATTAAPLNLKPNGRVVLQPKTANLTTFFQVKDQGGTAFVVGDSTNKILSLPYQPMVYAFRNSTQDLDPNADWNTVIFNDDSTTNDTAFDVGTDYATGTGIFTAPADGKYLISAEVMLTNTNTTDGSIILKCITTNSAADGINQYAGRVNPDTFATEPDYVQIPGTWLASMDSGDTAYVQVRNTSADSNSKIYGATTNAYTRIQIMKVA